LIIHPENTGKVKKTASVKKKEIFKNRVMYSPENEINAEKIFISNPLESDSTCYDLPMLQ